MAPVSTETSRQPRQRDGWLAALGDRLAQAAVDAWPHAAGVTFSGLALRPPTAGQQATVALRVAAERLQMRAAFAAGGAGGDGQAAELQDWLTGAAGVLADLLGDVELVHGGVVGEVPEGTPALEFRLQSGAPCWLWLPGQVLEAALPAVEAAASAAGPQVRGVAVFPSLAADPAGAGADPAALLDVPLVVSVELGRTERQIRDILTLVPGSVIELDRLAGDPLDVLVNGRKVARAEVLVVDEQFAIRITEVLSPSERMEQLG